MTPATLVIDRNFPGVGRIKKASGTTIPAVRRKLNRMLDDLADSGRLDLLRAIRDGDLTLLQVHDAYQRKALDQLPTADTARPLAEAWEAWRGALVVPDDVSAKHKRSLLTSLDYFRAAAPKALVADIARVLQGLRTTLGAKHPRSFNLARAAAMAFVRDTLRRSHPLWMECAAVPVKKVRQQKKHRPLSPEQLRGFFPAPATDPLDAIAWGMATTGMGQEEYWGRWETRADRVHIEGTKRKGRVRDVPRFFTPAPPALHRSTFERKLRERTSRAISPYDLRRSFANWMESAGIPRTRRRLYMGHGAGNVTDLYEIHEVAAFLAEDAAKLGRFAGFDAAHTESHTMRLVKHEGAQG